MRRIAKTLCISIVFFIAAPIQALTINGAPRKSLLSVCFDDASIRMVVKNNEELINKKSWIRDAIQLESWGYYTKLRFAGWGSCSSSPESDIRISANGAVSYGNTIEVPFTNTSNPSFERYHIQSATIHEMGHQLGFPHEHLRPDSSFYDESNNQRFRIRSVDNIWFRIIPDIDLNLCLAISGSKIIQEPCLNTSLGQQFKFKDGPLGTWTRIENRANANCLDIGGGGADWGTGLIHWSCHDGDNQKFKTVRYDYINLSESNYGIQVKSSQLWLDIPGGNTSSGVQPIQYPAYFTNFRYLTPRYDSSSVMSYENNSLRPSSFILTDGDIAGARAAYGSSGKSKVQDYIVAKHSKKCLLVNSDSQKVEQSRCDSNINMQTLRILFLDKNYFRIFDTRTQKCLSERNNHLTFESCELETESAVDIHQRFRYLEGEGSTWSRIQSKSSSQCLDVAWADASDGAEVLLWECHNDDNQKFQVSKKLPSNACGLLCARFETNI